MSIKAMSLVWDNFKECGSPKLVLLAMADWCNDEGGSLHPSISSIAKKACVSEKQARRIVHDLISDEYLEVVGNHFGGSIGNSRQYRLNLQKLSTPPAQGSRTPPTGVTPPVDVTPPTHGRPTPPAGVPPPLPPVGAKPPLNHHSTANKKHVVASKEITFDEFLDSCDKKNELPIPESDPVYAWAESVGLPIDVLALGWAAFKSREWRDKKGKVKTYVDWRKTFRTYCRNPDWLGVWSINRDGEYFLTAMGKQLDREINRRAA